MRPTFIILLAMAFLHLSEGGSFPANIDGSGIDREAFSEPVISCAEDLVHFYSARGLEEEICEITEKSVTFLAAIDLHLEDVVKVRIVNNIGCPVPDTCVAYFSKKDNSITMLDWREIGKNDYRKWLYGLEYKLENIGAVIGHEIAHKILYSIGKKKGEKVPMGVQEYIASVTQLSTLNEESRNNILNVYKDYYFEKIEDISLMGYYLGPELFSVQSYRHFISTIDKKGLVLNLINLKEQYYDHTGF